MFPLSPRWLLAALCFTALPLAAAEPLTLAEATRLASHRQPLLLAQAAEIAATREQALASTQLPDPTLVTGLSDLTLEGRDRFSLRREGDTQFMVGLRQEFPGGRKRPLRGELLDRTASRMALELDDASRMAEREAGMEWLMVWQAVQAQALVRSSEVQARQQLAAAEAAYRAARANQAEVIAAKVALAKLADERLKREQDESHARNNLSRWIGTEAFRPLAELAEWHAPDAEHLQDHLHHHPHLVALTRAVAEAETAIALAEAENQPDYSVQASYGHRPAFADYASVQFEIGLPVAKASRQARGVAAARARREAAEQQLADGLRQHSAELALNLADWQRLQVRLSRYQSEILPAAELRVASSLAAYRAGTLPMAQLLEARQQGLELQMTRLDLQLDAARHQLALSYFAHRDDEVLP